MMLELSFIYVHTSSIALAALPVISSAYFESRISIGLSMHWSSWAGLISEQTKRYVNLINDFGLH